MRHFDELHPLVLGIYFLAVIIPVMFAVNLYMAAASLITGIAFGWYLDGKVPLGRIGMSMVIVAAMTICNGIFSHKGTNELFFVNGRAVTLEAVRYGIVTGIMLSAVFVWFGNFSHVMTGEKIMQLFAKMPRMALVISMILRLVPEYIRRYREVNEAQAANHCESGESRAGILKISSAVFTWALENSMQTADSIIRRNGQNCRIVRKKAFKSRDIIILLIIILIQAAYLAPGIYKTAGIAVIGFLPLLWEGKECIRWRLYSLKK